jgi:superoxide dismutase, Cu-Zn family
MVKPATVVAALLVVPTLALSACSPKQNPTSTPGTVPPVWTGSTSPSASPTHGPAGEGEKLTAQLSTADGKPVATATFEFASGFATVTVETIGDGILTPGFHGMHIHSVGKCEANSVPPTGGPPGAFLSAAGHFQAPGHTGHPASGDLSSLEVRANGSAKLVTTTDTFTAEQLLAGQGTAIIIHEKPDNFANIPDRYTQADGTPGPDAETLATGDAGKRVACGVITG